MTDNYQFTFFLLDTVSIFFLFDTVSIFFLFDTVSIFVHDR